MNSMLWEFQLMPEVNVSLNMFLTGNASLKQINSKDGPEDSAKIKELNISDAVISSKYEYNSLEKIDTILTT